ncbi:DedA family protein [Nocardioides marmoriginsengisoli]|uniref:DedA family protein n=1 Tax=Nocardioides marmoriginsengisoli TaxID=661483 RepID=A0A3N0CRT9_9ACTN|nr:DedA family protein [Nocardioides marmoriginsengisoli]RNL66177.1 DedA family protein [Nocardioides marmoriginsengisoli]
MTGVLDNLLTLNPVWLLSVAALLVFLEDAIFVGFVIPGETAAVLAGVGSSLQHLSLAVSIVVIVVAAVVGDSVGYEVGKKFFGPRVMASKLLAQHQVRVGRAQEFLRRRGGIAVFLGRFTAFFRAMMPALAGASGMPYRTFLAWNAIGGIVWGAAFVVLGYAAGSSYHRVEHQVGRGLAIGLVGVVVALLVVWRVRSEREPRNAEGPDV